MTLAVDVALIVLRTQSREVANLAVAALVGRLEPVTARVEVGFCASWVNTNHLAVLARPRLVDLSVLATCGARLLAACSTLNVRLLRQPHNLDRFLTSRIQPVF